MGACGAGGSGGAELDYRSGDPNEIRERFIQAGQGHVFNGWEDMDDDEKDNFTKECCQFDVNNMN